VTKSNSVATKAYDAAECACVRRTLFSLGRGAGSRYSGTRALLVTASQQRAVSSFHHGVLSEVLSFFKQVVSKLGKRYRFETVEDR
jgi:hypothetical protein